MTVAEGMLDAFDRAGWGALLIGAQGRVMSLNGQAARHVGCEITISHGQIAATHRTANAELKHRIAAILSGDKVPLGGVLLPCPGRHPVMAYVISVAGPGGGSQREAQAIVVLIDSDKKSDPTEKALRRERMSAAEHSAP